MAERSFITLLRRYRDLLLVVILLVLPIVFYASNSKSSRDHNVVDRVVVSVSAPVQWLVVTTLDGVSSLWHSYVGLVHVQADNDRLKADNAHLRAELVKREEQRIENERLRLLVGLTARAPQVRMVYGHVIATAPTPLFRSLRIDRGLRDGVHLGAAVLDEDGVVGRIAALTDGYADVMLVVDANSSTDVLVERTRARGRVRGTGGDTHLGLQVDYLSRTADVEPGDVLITSGTGAVFPKGLVIGTILGLERGAYGLYQRAVVEPAVNFGKVEDVMVIVGGATADTSFEAERRDMAAKPVLVDGIPLSTPSLLPKTASPVAAPPPPHAAESLEDAGSLQPTEVGQ